MKIVIDIPEEMYKEYVSVNLGRGNGKTVTDNLLKAIKNGTPLPKGHWISDKSRPALQDCSICGALSIAKTNYCSNCGADMRGDDNGE